MEKKLLNVIAQIKSTKDQYNSFGKYKYRTAEGILDTVKPLLKAEGLLLTIDDEMVMLGDRFYIKATATVTDIESGKKVSSSAYAREAMSLKGQSEGQITGTTSSYARKFALGGLFCLSPAEDLDDESVHPNNNKAEKEDKAIIDDLVWKIEVSAEEHGVPIEKLCTMGGVKKLTELPATRLQNLLNALESGAIK